MNVYFDLERSSIKVEDIDAGHLLMDLSCA